MHASGSRTHDRETGSPSLLSCPTKLRFTSMKRARWLWIILLACACVAPRDAARNERPDTEGLDADRRAELIVLSNGMVLAGPVLREPGNPQRERLDSYLDAVAQGPSRVHILADQSVRFFHLLALMESCKERGIEVEIKLDQVEPAPRSSVRSNE